VFLFPGFAQTTALEPLRYPSGAVLDFHLQTRFSPASENRADLLPKGTLLHVKLLSPVDSDTTQDGSEIRGVVNSPVVSGDQIVVHSEAEAEILFVVLRNRTHPQGFRYELLVTKVIDGGKSLDLTASLGPSFADAPAGAAIDRKPAPVSATKAGASSELVKDSEKSSN
jgi:hypothetical protein